MTYTTEYETRDGKTTVKKPAQSNGSVEIQTTEKKQD